MNFSVRNRLREWSCGRSGCDQRPNAVAALLVLLLCAAPAQAYLTGHSVPLPKPRPAEAPVTDLQTPAEADKGDKPAEAAAPVAEKRPAEPPPPSACRVALDDSIAIAPSVPDIKGPGACGGPDMVHLEAVILPDRTRVPLKPGGTMRCTMAAAIADWIRTDMAPLAAGLGSKLSELDNFDSFDCRGRNRVVGAKMSEHGRANALDVRGLKLANGQSIALTDRATPREQREKVLLSMCTRFSTVLGPGSDGYHEDHIHLDLAERRNNYKICQWDVWDPLPQVAPLMPAIRPDDAPPREVADKSDGKGDGKAEAAPAPAVAEQSSAAEPAADEAEPEPDRPVKPKPKPRKRRTAPSTSPFSFLR
ncbi:extensin family protein [Rhodopseudomonas sp. P2A-2r]|uniref:extensin family protein n=1 Tax=Rhodopseudomonas sp. P2A-2r TaxID=2991972 RepID=UPI0022341B7D|nr:extensin family protein [Rhodopseudomonas sp. P2A-2r]UZE50609.1 extensin family protein [Rhodopseudomonas sp. P2A-2r]